MKKLILISLTIFLAAIFALPFLANAATNPCPPGTSINACQQAALNQIGSKVGWSGAGAVDSTTLSQKIGQIISYVLAFLGVAFLVLVVLSGIQWMTAGGNEEKVTKARTRLINATIGLAIVMAAYAITWFVVDKLQTSIAPSATPPAVGGGTPLASCSGFATHEICQDNETHYCVWSFECSFNVAAAFNCSNILPGNCNVNDCTLVNGSCTTSN